MQAADRSQSFDESGSSRKIVKRVGKESTTSQIHTVNHNSKSGLKDYAHGLNPGTIHRISNAGSKRQYPSIYWRQTNSICRG
jgi:hypothetical protein